MQTPHAVRSRAFLDVADEDTSEAALLYVGVDKQRAQAFVERVELGHPDDTSSVLDHDCFEGPQGFLEQVQRVAPVDGESLRGRLVVAAPVVDRAPHETQNVGHLLETDRTYLHRDGTGCRQMRARIAHGFDCVRLGAAAPLARRGQDDEQDTAPRVP